MALSHESTPPPGQEPPAGDELQASITMLDFLRVWYRYRVPFWIGFILVGVCSFVLAKFVMQKYYRAQATFNIGRRFTPESMVGLAEAEVFIGGRNEQFQTVQQSALAERMLTSKPLLAEVAANLLDQDDIDLYKRLGITEEDPERRQDFLVKLLVDDLLRVSQIQNTGIMVFGAEMPDPRLAARFVNESLDVLQEKFIEQEFAYFDQALVLYRQQLERENAQRDEWARELQTLNEKHYYDRSETIERRRAALSERLDLQAEKIAELSVRIQQLSLAVNPEAKRAAQPVKVLDPAMVPLEKSRPKTIISTLMMLALYTMVFMIGLVIVSYLRDAAPGTAGRRQ